jgi:hypothetical protein
MTLMRRLAQRNESGIITGDMFVNGKPLPAQFQRSCGYVQQQDVSHNIVALTLGPYGGKYSKGSSPVLCTTSTASYSQCRG